MARSDPRRAPAVPTAAESAARHAAIVAEMRAGRAAPLPPRKHVQFKLTHAEREAIIAEEAYYHRPNGFRSGAGR